MHPSQTYTMQAQLLSNFLQPRVFVFKMGNFCLTGFYTKYQFCPYCIGSWQCESFQ